MISQSGIISFEAYKAQTVTFDVISTTEISNVAGTKTDISSCENPNLQESVQKINRKLYQSFILTFLLYGLDQVNFSQWKNPPGWIFTVKYANGDEYLINTPMFVDESKLATIETNVYFLTFSQNRPSRNLLKIV